MNLSYLRRSVPAVLITSLGVFALAACGGSSDTASKCPTPAKGSTLLIATDASYAPMESFAADGKTISGADVDLANAIGKQIGYPVKMQNAGFDGIIAGIAACKYNLGMSSFTDNKEREKTVDFVTYLSAGSSFFTPAGKATVNTKQDLCGLKVAVEKGTVQADDATAEAKLCPAGKKLELQVYPDQNLTNQAVMSGRADVGISDSPVAAYAVKQSNGKLVLSGKSYDSAPYGIALPKGSELASKIKDALAAMIASGEYKQILTKWGLDSGAITEPTVNGATS